MQTIYLLLWIYFDVNYIYLLFYIYYIFLFYLTVLNFILNQFLYNFKIPCFIILIPCFYCCEWLFHFLLCKALWITTVYEMCYINKLALPCLALQIHHHVDMLCYYKTLMTNISSNIFNCCVYRAAADTFVNDFTWTHCTSCLFNTAWFIHLLLLIGQTLLTHPPNKRKRPFLKRKAASSGGHICRLHTSSSLVYFS